MKKGQRILAILGIILLLVMYGSTLFFAITDNSDTMGLFRASIYTTIVVPVLIWAYTFIYKLIHGKKDDDEKASQAENNNPTSKR